MDIDTAIASAPAIYCLTDDFLKAIGHREDAQTTMSDAEVITTALVAARFFGVGFELARQDLHKPDLGFTRESGITVKPQEPGSGQPSAPRVSREARST